MPLFVWVNVAVDVAVPAFIVVVVVTVSVAIDFRTALPMTRCVVLLLLSSSSSYSMHADLPILLIISNGSIFLSANDSLALLSFCSAFVRHGSKSVAVIVVVVVDVDWPDGTFAASIRFKTPG